MTPELALVAASSGPFIVHECAVLGIVTYVTLLERKFAARMQSRIGPYRLARTACCNRSPTPSS